MNKGDSIVANRHADSLCVVDKGPHMTGSSCCFGVGERMASGQGSHTTMEPWNRSVRRSSAVLCWEGEKAVAGDGETMHLHLLMLNARLNWDWIGQTRAWGARQGLTRGALGTALGAARQMGMDVRSGQEQRRSGVDNERCLGEETKNEKMKKEYHYKLVVCLREEESPRAGRSRRESGAEGRKHQARGCDTRGWLHCLNIHTGRYEVLPLLGKCVRCHHCSCCVFTSTRYPYCICRRPPQHRKWKKWKTKHPKKQTKRNAANEGPTVDSLTLVGGSAMAGAAAALAGIDRIAPGGSKVDLSTRTM
jgi:hypothetical protein